MNQMADGLSNTASRLFSREKLRSVSALLGSGEERAFGCETAPSELKSRLQFNLGYFYLNYVYLVGMLFAINVFFSPSAWVGLAVLAVAWFAMINTITDERMLKIASTFLFCVMYYTVWFCILYLNLYLYIVLVIYIGRTSIIMYFTPTNEGIILIIHFLCSLIFSSLSLWGCWTNRAITTCISQQNKTGTLSTNLGYHLPTSNHDNSFRFATIHPYNPSIANNPRQPTNQRHCV